MENRAKIIRMRDKRVSICLLFIMGALLTVSVNAPDSLAADKPKILLIHSYHAEYPWVASITQGVKEALKGKKVILEIFYMDTKRKTTQVWKVQAGKLARKKIDGWKPDVVIAADDNAQIFVTQQYVGSEPYFVFCGVNGDPADYGLPASNVTGIIERPHFMASLAYLSDIVPNVRRVAIMSDNGPTSVGALDFMQKESCDIKVLDYRLIGDFELWKKRVSEYNIDADALCIYMYHTIQQEGVVMSMPPQQVMTWTRENCTIPTIGYFDFAIEDGMFCGVVESGKEHGYEAAQMALALLNGEDIKNLPVKTAQEELKMINLTTAEKLGLTVPAEVLASTDRVVKWE